MKCKVICYGGWAYSNKQRYLLRVLAGRQSPLGAPEFNLLLLPSLWKGTHMLGWSCLRTFPVRLGFQTRKEREKPSNFKRVNCLVTAKFSCTFLGISNLAFMHCGKQTQTKLQENIEEGYSPKES